MIDTNYHGHIRMYDYITREDWLYHIEYDIWFTFGDVYTVELTFNKIDNSINRAAIFKAWKDVHAENAKWYNKYIFHKPYFFRLRSRWNKLIDRCKF